MYKSKYEIPLVIENPGGYSEKQPALGFWTIAFLVLQFIQVVIKHSLHIIWAFLVGVFGFLRSIWRAHPGLQTLPWLRLSVLIVLAYLVLGNSTSSSDPIGPVDPSPAAVLIANPAEEESATKREQDLSPIAPALLKHPSVADFINRFKKVAREEMKLYGIPASIKMGQAIIESQAGKSVLAKNSNNYFGIKCKAKCLGCTCKNYADDNKYDMFRVFDSAWESWRAHSKLLCNPRYGKLPLYGKDYKKWAKGLKAAGYATDPAYAEKLISVIEKYNLTMLDQ